MDSFIENYIVKIELNVQGQKIQKWSKYLKNLSILWLKLRNLVNALDKKALEYKNSNFDS